MQISIHAPPRGATVSPDSEGKLYIFQFTPLREGRRKVNDTYEEAPIFQFTPLREGRRLLDLAAAGATISIHAPPRGATFVVEAAVLAGHISIHAPPRGATKGIYGGEVSLLFQFTPLREGRLVRSPYDGSEEQFQFTPLREGRRSAGLGRSRSNISIHAPPRGATLLCCVCRSPRRFQFTPLREGRHVFAKAATSSNTFQFTPLREGRHKAPSALVQLAISIHAPPRGATKHKRGYKR